MKILSFEENNTYNQFLEQNKLHNNDFLSAVNEEIIK